MKSLFSQEFGEFLSQVFKMCQTNVNTQKKKKMFHILN